MPRINDATHYPLVASAAQVDDNDVLVVVVDDVQMQLPISVMQELAGGGGEVLTQMSITTDALGLKLVSDEDAPGNSTYYGTDGTGLKGYHPLPTPPALGSAAYEDIGTSGATVPLLSTANTWSAAQTFGTVFAEAASLESLAMNGGEITSLGTPSDPDSAATKAYVDAVTLAALGGQPLDTDLTAIAALPDPGADRILFWDDSLGAYTHLSLGINLSITGTTLDAAGGGGGGTPGGADTQVQFNDGGAFGGDDGLLYNKTTNAFIVKGMVSQTANLQEWQSSAGAALSHVDATGRLVLKGGASGDFLRFDGGTYHYKVGRSDLDGYLEISGTQVGYVGIRVVGGHLKADGDVQIGAAGSMSWGGVSTMARNNSNGEVSLNLQAYSGANFAVKLGDPGARMFVRGAASQTASLQEWQDNSGTALLYVTSAGGIAAGVPASGAGNPLTLSGSAAASGNTDGGNVLLTPGLKAGAGNDGKVIVKAASASPGANLHEWQDSAGTPLSTVDKDGYAFILTPTFALALGVNAATGTNLTNLVVIPRNGKIVKAFAACKTAPTGAALLFDINLNGSTIWSTQANRLTIAAGATSGNTTTFNTTALTEGDTLSIDIDQVGSTVAGSNITVTLLCLMRNQ